MYTVCERPACPGRQVPEYAKHFTCISFDPRGTGESDKRGTGYSTEDLADDIAGLMRVLNIPAAHIMGLSLGAGVGLCFAAKYPEKVKSVSAHGGWTKTDLFLKTIIESWKVSAKALDSVPEMVIQNVFPWCLTPELYAEKPEYIQGLCDFVRSRPPQSVAEFTLQANAVLGHNIEESLSNITAPTQITLGNHDMVTSMRFVKPMQEKIRNTELIVFEECAHAPLFEKVEEFNQKTLSFLLKNQTMSAGA